MCYKKNYNYNMCHKKQNNPVRYVTDTITKTQMKCNDFLKKARAKYLTKTQINYNDFFKSKRGPNGIITA